MQLTVCIMDPRVEYIRAMIFCENIIFEAWSTYLHYDDVNVEMSERDKNAW